MKRRAIRGRRHVVEKEHKNLGAAAVLFVMALACSQSAEIAQTSFEVIGRLAAIVAGGMAIGTVCGGAALIVAWPSSEHLIEGDWRLIFPRRKEWTSAAKGASLPTTEVLWSL